MVNKYKMTNFHQKLDHTLEKPICSNIQSEVKYILEKQTL